MTTTTTSNYHRKLLYLLLLFNCCRATHGLSIVTTTASQSSDPTTTEEATTTKNATDPVVYTKLRHDANNLQVFRKYQLKETHKEKSQTLKVNETFDDNSTREVSYTFYENTAIEASSITQDDLILEALDRTYKSRLLPVYIHNYDSLRDRLKSSDPSLTSASRCERELNYLMDRLRLLEEAHRDRKNLSIAPELAAFFDSFAGEEPGLLYGNYHWTGNWRQCYKRLVFDLDRANNSNTIAFRGRYCTANIRSSSWTARIHKKTQQLHEQSYFENPAREYDYARFFRIQVGLCLPESCDSNIVERRRADIHKLALFRVGEPFKSYDLVDLYCLPDETSELRRIEPMGKLLILLALVWLTVIAAATYFDHKATTESSSSSSSSKSFAAAAKKSRQSRGATKTDGIVVIKPKSIADKLISAFSLMKNWHRLTETESITRATAVAPPSAADKKAEEPKGGVVAVVSPPPPPARSTMSPNDLLFLNAYKVISMPLIIYGHTGMLSVHSNRFPLDYESFGNEAMFHFSSSTVFFVDWYFVTTGFLTSYLMFVTKKVERNKLIDWIYSMFHRYWRLAPLYILLFWFNKYLFQHLSQGPVWDYGTSNMTIRSVCRRESWLWPILLASNLHPIHEECIMPAWYIANDMQFYIITPFILVGLLYQPKVTWLATLGAIFACVSGRMHRYSTDPKAQPLELMRPGFDLYMRNNWDMYPTYIYPHYRISSHLIGILAGHYAYKVLKGDWKSRLYNPSWFSSSRSNKSSNTASSSNTSGRMMGRFLWIAGCQMVIYMAFATWPIKDFFPRSLEPQIKYFTAVIYGLSHSTAALGMALMFVSLILGHFAPIRRFLTLPFWTLVSRVNFIVYLIQVEVIYLVWQSGERVPDFSGREAIKYWILLTCLCYSLSAVLTLLIELPLAHLEREFVGTWMAAKSKQAAQKSAAQKAAGQQCEMVTRSESTHLVGGETDQHQSSSKSASKK